MNTLKRLSILLVLLILASCGTSHRVVTNDGNVYNVKGETIENAGVEVTNDLSAADRRAIKNIIKEKEKSEKAFKKQQEALEDAIENQRDIQKESERKEDELKEKLKSLEANWYLQQDAKDDYAALKVRYDEKSKEFEKLKSKGELSSKDLKSWNEKLDKMKREMIEAKNKV